MKYLFEIDDRSKTGKNVLPLLKDLSKNGKGIDYLSEEEAEDRFLCMLIKEGLKSGLASKKRVLAKLGISEI
ncbi:MAG: hypothetical protein HKL88_01590 [Bacteroidia bacterium]|nr:hypothetical protein [Bacteroidia bacterium]